MKKITVNYKGQIGEYATQGSAGIDLIADVNYTLKPQEIYCVPTGLFLEIPQGFEAQIRPRSGMTFKNKIIVANSPGTIDSDYRGEIKIIMMNLSKENFEIKRGMRIAQMVFQEVIVAKMNFTQELSSTTRGKEGFGSTGMYIKTSL